MIEEAMESSYKTALRQLRRASLGGPSSYSGDLNSPGWAYAQETERSGREAVVENEVSPKDSVSAKSGAVTEKTKVLDSFHEFARAQMQGDKESFRFPGGEAKKKPAASALFTDVVCAERDLAGLRRLSEERSKLFGSQKYSFTPQAPLKIMFVCHESADLSSLTEERLPLEAFFEENAARLFEKMIAAMKLSAEESFVSSLKVLNGGKSSSFEESLAQEIYNLKPGIVAPLGGAATSRILGEGFTLRDSHGQFYIREINGEAGTFSFEVMPFFSPAFLVEAPNTKRIAWEDMQKAMKKWASS